MKTLREWTLQYFHDFIIYIQIIENKRLVSIGWDISKRYQPIYGQPYHLLYITTNKETKNMTGRYEFIKFLNNSPL